MKRNTRIPDLASINEDTPLQLQVAMQLSFPDGSMSVQAMRRERDKGTLRVERIGGRDYTTLGAIKKMRELCLVKPKERGSAVISGRRVTDGAIAVAAAKMTVQRLREQFREQAKQERKKRKTELGSR